MTEVKDALEGVTRFKWDAADRLLEAEDAAGREDALCLRPRRSLGVGDGHRGTGDGVHLRRIGEGDGHRVRRAGSARNWCGRRGAICRGCAITWRGRARRSGTSISSTTRRPSVVMEGGKARGELQVGHTGATGWR